MEQSHQTNCSANHNIKSVKKISVINPFSIEALISNNNNNHIEKDNDKKLVISEPREKFTNMTSLQHKQNVMLSANFCQFNVPNLHGGHPFWYPPVVQNNDFSSAIANFYRNNQSSTSLQHQEKQFCNTDLTNQSPLPISDQANLDLVEDLSIRSMLK